MDDRQFTAVIREVCVSIWSHLSRRVWLCVSDGKRLAAVVDYEELAPKYG
jgi:hypothetical protein